MYLLLFILIQTILFVYTNGEEKTEFICSRNHTNVELNKNGKHPLLTILDNIKVVTVNADYFNEQIEKNMLGLKTEERWNLFYKLFSPLPQWRRKQVVLLYCELILKIQNDLENCFNRLFPIKGRKNSKLLELLIIDKSEALAERLFDNLSSKESNTDFDTLYDIILASPKFELQKIIKFYSKKKLEHLTAVSEKNNLSNISKLEEHLHYKKQLENDKEKNEVWKILIERVNSVNKGVFSEDIEIEKIFNKIIKYCKDSENANNELKTLSYTHIILRNYVYKSKYITEVANKFFEKCGGISIEKIHRNDEHLKKEIGNSGRKTFELNITLPEYIKRMFIITGLNGELKQQEDITKQLLSLVVVHHGKDLFDIIKPLKNEIKIDNDMLEFYFKNIVENCNEETEKEYKIDLELGALEYEYKTRVEKMNKLIESEKFKNISVDVINKYCNIENVLKFCNNFLHQNVFEGYKNDEKNFEKIYENFQKEAKVLKEMENLTEEKRTSCIIFVIKREKEKFCKKVENFKEEFEQKYLQNEIKNREDFETIGEWKKEKEKLIDNLIIDCIENELPNSEKLFEIKEMPNSLSFGSNHPFSSSSTFSIGESSTSTTKGWPLNNAEMAIMREYFSHDDSMQLYSDNDSLSSNELNEGNNSDESELLELDLHPHQQNYPPEAEVINIDENTSPPYSPNSSSEESNKFVKHKNLKNETKQKKGENKIVKHSIFSNNPNSTLSNLQPLQNKSPKKGNLKRSKTF